MLFVFCVVFVSMGSEVIVFLNGEGIDVGEEFELISFVLIESVWLVGVWEVIKLFMMGVDLNDWVSNLLWFVNEVSLL